jgi:hypothetical protein
VTIGGRQDDERVGLGASRSGGEGRAQGGREEYERDRGGREAGHVRSPAFGSVARRRWSSGPAPGRRARTRMRRTPPRHATGRGRRRPIGGAGRGGRSGPARTCAASLPGTHPFGPQPSAGRSSTTRASARTPDARARITLEASMPRNRCHSRVARFSGAALLLRFSATDQSRA